MNLDRSIENLRTFGLVIFKKENLKTFMVFEDRTNLVLVEDSVYTLLSGNG